MATIISALISAGVTLMVCLITQHYQSNKDRALIEYKLDVQTELQEEKIKVANHRIEDLEKKGEKQ